MDKDLLKYDEDVLQSMLIIVRGRRVFLSSDLAGLYGVKPRVRSRSQFVTLNR